jgi:hypothetical protein
MDGATNELLASGYGRTAELRRLAEAAGERWGSKLALELHGKHIEDISWRGIGWFPDRWPEALWELFVCSPDSDGLDEDECIEMREPFVHAATLQLENDGYCCR